MGRTQERIGVEGFSMTRMRLSTVVAGVVLAAVLTLAAPVFGQTDFLWNVPTGGEYGVGANWFPVGAPTAADYAEFEISGSYTVSFDGDYTASYMDFGRGRVAFDLRGYTYDLTNV